MHGKVTDYFPGAAKTYTMGYTFLSLFNTDENSVYHKTNLYYPFSCKEDWEIVLWLLHSGLSMGKIDTFLSLEMIKDLPLSFRSAKELQGQAEMLPSSPCWMSQIHTSHPTKSPIVLYWRDPLECISTILNHPFFLDQLDFTPCKVYSTVKRLCHVFTEWMTGNDAWNMQSALPQGATLLGTILSLDKTNISTLTGNRIVHPLLIGLANIRMNTQLKSSSNSFVLTALLLVLKFLHKNKHLCGVLADRLVHQCLDIILKPLKEATLHVFFREVQKFRLNGVSEPFWRDWVLIDPSCFFTPETLHVFHKEFWDHDAKWLIFAVGESEMDFHFSVLHHVTGFWCFAEGISKLKQVMGHCQRDIQHSIIAYSADAVPHRVLIAVCTLMDFRYLVQSSSIDDNDLVRISAALKELHEHKDAIIDARVHRGKGKKVIDNWYILKLELMQSIIPSIRNSGVTAQWSADVTEHAHITEIKDPVRSSNNNNYELQICRHLDRLDKCLWFELATTLLNEKQNIKTSDDIPVEFLSSMILLLKPIGSIPLPLRSFMVGRIAFHLAYDPSIQNITVDDVAIKFGLPDFFGCNHTHAIGGPRRAGPNAMLPFENIQVWFKLCLQDTDFHNTHNIWPAQTLNCVPPSEPWTCGHYDSIIINTEAEHSWPTSGLKGHTVAQIRLIFCPLGKTGAQWAWQDQFLTYVHCFNIVGAREPTTQMHVLKRAKQSNGTCMGDVVPISQLRAPVNLVPRFGATMDNHLTAYNCLEHVSELWLNCFWDKSTYFALSM
ncbi:hypothetical protein BDR05DRAFT_976868 [Suillus weaverae]|nr:hypothetical protein BDR05DRAFT_976868 [Suillus weaverae]